MAGQGWLTIRWYCKRGHNNIISKHSSMNKEIDIVNTILKTVDLCYRNGVTNVYVSGITCREEYQEKIDKINELLKNGTRGMNYTFIDNGNINAGMKFILIIMDSKY